MEVVPIQSDLTAAGDEFAARRKEQAAKCLRRIADMRRDGTPAPRQKHVLQVESNSVVR